MIELVNVCKSFDTQVVFQDFNLQIQTQQITGILASSGKGKTTLFRILMGLEEMDSGSIKGHENMRMSAVFQEDRLCDTLDIYTNILLPHIHKDSMKQISKHSIDTALAQIDLLDAKHKLVNELSGGMRQRISILRALFAQSDILFLDEPFKGLDSDTKLLTIQYVKKHIQNKTVLFITHDESELDLLGVDHVVRL